MFSKKTSPQNLRTHRGNQIFFLRNMPKQNEIRFILE